MTCSRLGDSCRHHLYDRLSWGAMVFCPFRTLACFHTAFTIHAMYFYLIVNFGNPKGLSSVVWYVYSVSDALYLVFICLCEQELQGDPHYMLLSSLTDTSWTSHQMQVVFNVSICPIPTVIVSWLPGFQTLMVLLVQRYASKALNLTELNEIGICSVAYTLWECGSVSSLQQVQFIISYLQDKKLGNTFPDFGRQSWCVNSLSDVRCLTSMNRGSLWQVDGVRNDKILLIHIFAKLPSPVAAVGIRESDSVELLFLNWLFPLIVAMVEAFKQTSFTNLESIKVSVNECCRAEGATHRKCRKFSMGPSPPLQESILYSLVPCVITLTGAGLPSLGEWWPLHDRTSILNLGWFISS
jgi:hypothetical protein